MGNIGPVELLLLLILVIAAVVLAVRFSRRR
jgi:hypothetical protein